MLTCNFNFMLRVRNFTTHN